MFLDRTRGWVGERRDSEKGETAEDGLRRELREEVGLVSFVPGPVLWRRHHTFDWGPRRISQREEYRVVHVSRFEPVMSDVVEAEEMDCFQWWRVSDLKKAEERLTPLSLANILQRYLTDGAPTGLLDEEVLID
jgi:8-oxo-dGTP pyrophosphatase MutT (NUDIX family)